MGKKLTFEYDKMGDILYVYSVPPYAEQESNELGNNVVGRYHPETGELECLEILWFARRMDKDKMLELPIDGFKLAV